MKDSVNRLAFLYLNSEKLKLSKISHIEHRAFEIQPYFTNGKLTIQQMKFLFAARSRGLDLRCNFKGKYPDTNCPLCSPLSVGAGPERSDEPQPDTQCHLLACPLLSDGTDMTSQTVQYSGSFDDDEDTQAMTAILLMNKYEERRRLLRQTADTS